jgi:hypothetical protein
VEPAAARVGVQQFSAPRAGHSYSPGVAELIKKIKPDLLVHAAAQPSHDLAASRPFDDFDVNANGTLNLLEAVRQHASECVFAYMSTNKVYGDRPNTIDLKELSTRWDYADPRLCQWHHRGDVDRSVQAQHLRGFEGGGGCDGSGIRPLLWHPILLPARWVPDRPEPLGRRASRRSSATSSSAI